MNAGDFRRTRWLGAYGGLAMGLLGCSQQTGSVPLAPPMPPVPAPSVPTPGEAVQHVKGSRTGDGDTYAVWVERQIAQDGRRLVFSDWSAQGSRVRFTYVLRDPDYRTTTHAFEWQVTDTHAPVTFPQHIELAGKGSAP